MFESAAPYRAIAESEIGYTTRESLRHVHKGALTACECQVNDMARRHQLFRASLVLSLLMLAVSSTGIFLLHGTVVACTVGFNNSSHPVGPGLASQCPKAEIGSAILITVALVSGAVAAWIGASYHLARGRLLSPGRFSSPPRLALGRSTSPGRLAKLLGWPALNGVYLLMAIFFAATFSLASWQYLHLIGGNYDLVINQQALSSAALGNKPYPLYEAINCGRHGQCSFLLVNQAFVAFGVALVYGAAPTPFTLFALQSLALSLGALPLYFLAIDVVHSRRWGLVVVGTYLVWLPLFMFASFDSFHWEPFLPVELLTIFLLWNRQRYLLAIPIILLAFLTEEVTTVLAFFVGLYFLWPWTVRAVRLFWQAITVPAEGPPGAPSRIRLWFCSIRTTLRVPEVYASLALAAGSLAAYVLLRLFEQDGASLLGVPPVVSSYALGVGSPNRVFVFSAAALSFAWTAKAWYWIVLFLTLGFVPFFAPRSLILVFPWVVLTFFNITRGFWSLGNQYSFIPTAALMIGFTLGLGELLRWTSGGVARSSEPPSTHVPAEGTTESDARTRRIRVRQRWSLDHRRARPNSPSAVALSVAVTVVIGGNLILGPWDPIASKIVPRLGPSFPPTYGIDWSSPPNDQALQQLISLIPKNAIVAAPQGIYTLVADDPYAYPMAHFTKPPLNLSLLPDNESQRTQFALFPYDTPEVEIYPILWTTLYNPSIFGVRGCVANSAVGGVELFQRNFTGQPEVFGPPDPLCPDYFDGETGLTPGRGSTLQISASSPSGVEIQSARCVNNTAVFSGPSLALPAGHYDFTIVFKAFACGQYRHPLLHFPLLSVSVSGSLPGTGTTTQFNESAVCSPCGSWYNGTGTFNLMTPTPSLNLACTVRLGQFVVQVAYIAIVPTE